jgi:hypothetical protein
MLSNTKLGGFRLEAARLLGELKDPSSHSGLVAMLREADDATQISAARSLARLDNEEIIAVLLDALPRLYDEARDEVRAIVVKAGAKAVPHVEAALRSDDPRVRAAALSIVAEWGRATPKPILTQLGLMLQDMRLPPQTSEAVKHAVVAATGITPKPDWTWREWVKACGVRPGALIESLELEDVVWDWVTMQVPKTWDRNRVSCSTLSTPGSPTISIMQRFDSVVSGHVRGFWTPQHKSLKDFAQNRIRALAMVTVGPNKWEPRATARVENTVGFSLGGYPSESFRIVDAETGRTTLYVLGWIKSAKTHWYLEVSFSAETGDYQEYKTLFETKVARSIRITPREIKLNSK